MKRLGLALLLFFSFILTASAETYRVSPGGLTLTEALSLCADGDTIELADGIYAEPKETFPLTVHSAVTLRAAEGAHPVIDGPVFKAALRVEADGVTLQNLDIRFRRTGVYAVGNDLTLEGCRLSLSEVAWRTSSCGIWCGGVYRMALRSCAFSGCGVSLAGPPLSESSEGKPVLTGLFEVGEEEAFFTSHTIENCLVNGKPLFYAVYQENVVCPDDAGEIICCGCGNVMVQNADVSDCSMGLVLAYDRFVTVEHVRADRCGVFGMYVAKCLGGVLRGCTARDTNHGLDVRASEGITLYDCAAMDCDQGLFFSKVTGCAMVNCTVSGTGQGYFMAGGSGNALLKCKAISCENGYNLQKEGQVSMTQCTAEGCTVCGVRLDATPAVFTNNTLRDNWVAVMAYGKVSFDFENNLFENSSSCGLYLRDIGESRFTGNIFTGSGQNSLQAAGTLGGSVWTGNALDLAADFSQAKDFFARFD